MEAGSEEGAGKRCWWSWRGRFRRSWSPNRKESRKKRRKEKVAVEDGIRRSREIEVAELVDVTISGETWIGPLDSTCFHSTVQCALINKFAEM